MKLLAASIFASLFLGSLCQSQDSNEEYRQAKFAGVVTMLSAECRRSVEKCTKEHEQELINIDVCTAVKSLRSCGLTESTYQGSKAQCTLEEYNKGLAAACTCGEESEAFGNLSDLTIPQSCFDRAATCNNNKSPDFSYMQLYCDFISQQKGCLLAGGSCTNQTYITWQEYTCKQYCPNSGIRGAQYSVLLMIVLAALSFLKM